MVHDTVTDTVIEGNAPDIRRLVGIARRENNKKRKYLVVNRFQGKHVPVSASDAFLMFEALARTVETEYKEERLLLVGFAETATAIGAALAVSLHTAYIQTTREEIEGVEYIFFSESHSHATQQKLVKSDLDLAVNQIDRILFVEDEVTTGNTILNIIDRLREEYGGRLQFSAASLLNGMDEAAANEYRKRGIKTHYLVKTNHDGFTAYAQRYRGDGIYHAKDTSRVAGCQSVRIPGCVDARRLTSGDEYSGACAGLWDRVKAYMPEDSGQKILVIGTEECMYPALFAAAQMEKEGYFVRCHSTTRSPIVVSSEQEYPLHARYELASLYDRTRTTYLYDIARYDKVFVITDADNGEEEGVRSLLHALSSEGNTNITLIRWCRFEKLV